MGVIITLAFFKFNERLFVGIDDHNACQSIYDDKIVILYGPGGFFKPQNRWYLQSAGNDAGMGSFAASVSDKPFYFFKIDLAGISWRKIRCHQDDTHIDIFYFKRFHTG